MGLFAIDTEFVGPGLPLWLPKGTVIVEELEKLAKETEFAAGYVRVKTPHIAKEKMYTTSGTCRTTRRSHVPADGLDSLREMQQELYAEIAARRSADYMLISNEKEMTRRASDGKGRFVRVECRISS